MHIKTTILASTLVLISGIVSQLPAAPEPGNMMIRVRGIGVIPQEKTTIKPIGGKIKVNNSFVPEIDFTYFFTQNISAELIAATTKHKGKIRGSSVGSLSAGHVWLLPPTLTLQYRFTCWNFVKPYAGAGVNYTIFYNEKKGDLTSISYEDRAAPALQLGFDFPFHNGWYFNLDMKKIFLKTTVKANNKTITAKMKLYPWLLGFGLGYRF